MALAALALFVVFMLLTGVRSLIQRHRTGDSGNRRELIPRRSWGWWGLAVADVGYLMVGLGAPLAALAGMPPVVADDLPVVHSLGSVLAVLGILAALTSQLALGASWRIGVHETESTILVTTGPFRLVRNPIFTAASTAFLGLTFMVPNLLAIIGLVVALAGIELQVRVVEEPYLRGTHGTTYTNYASRVGRFLPGIGLLRLDHPPKS